MTAVNHRLDFDDFMVFLATAVQHYEKSAPTVTTYLEDLYLRMDESAETVVLFEVLQAQALLENGQWEQPNLAANRIYKLLDRLGRGTVGQLGF